jgi:hypothetical protein
MHVLIVNFELEGVSEAEYDALADQIAPAFAEVPGLVRKIWIANPETGIYGGVYLWRDRQAFEEYRQSELFNTVATHPNLTNITAMDFAVMEGPTEVTRGTF